MDVDRDFLWLLSYTSSGYGLFTTRGGGRGNNLLNIRYKHASFFTLYILRLKVKIKRHVVRVMISSAMWKLPTNERV